MRPLQRQWITAALLVLSTIALHAGERTFTVRDSIEMTTLSDPNTLDLPQNGRAKFSPDGKHFLVVATRGILESDQLESCLMVFDTSSIDFTKHKATQLSKPQKCVAKLTATPHASEGEIYPAIITEARWSDDSKSIFFLAQDEQAERYLYRVDVRHGNPQQLSPSGYDVIQFACAKKVAVFIASPTASRNPNLGGSYGQTINRDSRDITGISLQNALFPGSNPITELNLQVWSKEGEDRGAVIATIPKPLAGQGSNIISISPDATKAVILVPVRSVPRDWDSYEPAQGAEEWGIHAENADPSTVEVSPNALQQYALIDLHNKRIMPLVDAPIGFALGYFDKLKAVWSEDGRRLLLTDTFMPIGDGGARQLEHPLRPCAVASIDLAQGVPRCVVPARRDKLETGVSRGAWQLQDVSFGSDSQEVSTTFVLPQLKQLIEKYRDTPGGWVGPSNDFERPEPSQSNQKIEVYIRQGLNDPPTLWAKSVATGDEVQVWDPNPQFRNISYGAASMYHWKDSSGYRWTGILLKPVGYVEGQRYPLVIQTHGYRDWAFVTDGIYPSAMAARPLASAGIAVLQTEYRYDIEGGPLEAESEADKFESAVRQLDEDGLIDPKRVGAIGFSRSCLHVEVTLINKPTLFRAATIADGIDHSYMQYRLFAVDSPGWMSDSERPIGGPPTGVEGLRKWFALAPGFRLDQVKAPVRLEGYGNAAPLGEWEIYSSLRMQGKPVDLIYIPDGSHVLQKPLERMASQQGDVDWFRFWLQDYQDPDPSKAELYKRWDSLKRLQDANDKAITGQLPAKTITPN